VSSIAEKLNIDGVDRISQDGLEAIIVAHPPVSTAGKIPQFHFSKRIKFTMKRQRIRLLLDSLSKSIALLDSYQAKAEKLEDTYVVESKLKFAFPTHLIQQNASWLFEVLFQSWCSGCPSHAAGILLEPRLAPKKKRGMRGWRQQQQGDLKKCSSDCFGISLLQSPTSRKWLDAEFHIVQPATKNNQFNG
jgi:hypothetical protein